MNKRVWTAMVPSLLGGVLRAQCKSSKAELVRRIVVDDPVWMGEGVKYVLAPRMAKKQFRRGLAIAWSGNDKTT